jgi:hypothetical protein
MNADLIVKPVRSSVILTNAYVAGTVVPAHLANQLKLLITFTIGSLTNTKIKIEYSMDGTTPFQETFSAITAGADALTLGEHVITASGAYVLDVPLMAPFVHVSAIGTGTVTNSLLAIQALVGTV